MGDNSEQQILEEMDQEMDKIVDQAFFWSQQFLIDQGKIDTGLLLKSANISRSFLNKEIIYPAVYADVTEFGRTAGSFPPVDPIQKWVKRKLGVRNEKEARSAAFAIARTIEQRGMQPAPYLRPAIDKAISEA